MSEQAVGHVRQKMFADLLSYVVLLASCVGRCLRLEAACVVVCINHGIWLRMFGNRKVLCLQVSLPVCRCKAGT